MRRGLLALCALLALLAPSPAAAELLAEIRSRGVLKVGMAEYEPWMTRGADGKPVGLEVELAERLAGDLGVELEVVAMPFEALVDRLAVREVDLIASNLSITPERALKVAFSEPYSLSAIRVVIRTDRTDPELTEDDLNVAGTEIAVTAGTTSAQAAAERFPLAEITEYPTHADARAALLDGQAVALVGSTPYPELLAAADDRVAILHEEPLRTTVEALAVPQGEPVLLTFLNNWLDAVAAEGFVEAARSDWLIPHTPPAR